MLNWLRAVARFLTNTIGWNRIGVLLSLAIIAVAAVVLSHMLRDLDVDQVFAAMKAVTPHRIALAALFVAGGYFTLTFYDWFALRTIGRSRDSRIASRRCPASPAIRSATISAPPSSPAARCATASIRPTG